MELDIKKFLAQRDVQEAYITGAGGTGKTEMLISIVKTLEESKIPYLILAYTNKAVGVIKARLEGNANVKTLHSFLQKRPTINSMAENIKSMFTTMQYGKPETIQLVIVDEFSMVGEKDYMDLGELIDPEQIGDMLMHCLYIGDLNQLPPVGSVCPIKPKGRYWINLTKIWRTGTDLVAALDYIRELQLQNAEIYLDYIPKCESLVREVDIVTAYLEDKSNDKILLAWTNERVQELNARVQDRIAPEIGDKIYDSTLKETLQLVSILSLDVIMYTEYVTYKKDQMVSRHTKYNPLLTVRDIKDVGLYSVVDEEGTEFNIIGIFGSKNFKRVEEMYARNLATANAEKKDSRNQYRFLKTFTDLVHQLDFNHCITVHKSQGSQYENVYLDYQDMNKNKSLSDKLKLVYTAMSRAKSKVFLNA